MYRLALIIVSVLLPTPVNVDGSSTVCKTQTGARGVCVSIKRCLPAILLIKTQTSLKVYDDLRKEHCGWDGEVPKICCERGERVKHDDERIHSGEPTSTQPNLRLLEHDLCGRVYPGADDRFKIYGGTATKLFEFPWMALLDYEESGPYGMNHKFRCAGTIVNRHYVMTAAHCVTNLPESLKLVRVRVGEHNLAEETDCETIDNGAAYLCAEKYQEFGIAKVIAHPEYFNETLRNDIALIRTTGPMNFKPANVRPICLPLFLSPLPSSGWVTGWGATEKDDAWSKVLLKVQLSVLPNAMCKRWYENLWHRQLCAGGTNAEDSCTGDSGGPFQRLEPYRDGQPKIVQRGIVSYGKQNCGLQNVPAVYTNVAYYIDWILDMMEE